MKFLSLMFSGLVVVSEAVCVCNDVDDNSALGVQNFGAGNFG
jgi:hypothetical protein